MADPTETALNYVLVQLGGGPGEPLVTIKITETAAGVFSFEVTQSGDYVGDLRGIFFDVAKDDGLSTTTGGKKPTTTLNVSAEGDDVGKIQAGNDSVTDLGNGANMNGALGFNDTGAEAKGYDVGIPIGTAGIGKDDIQDTNFTFKASMLTLADFVGMDFGVRMTSVGTEGGDRSGSLKLTSSSFVPVDDGNEPVGCVIEEGKASGDLIADTAPAGGGSVSQTLLSLTLKDAEGNVLASHDFSDGDPWTVALDDVVQGATTEGATLTIYANGSYEVNSGGDPLGANEHIGFNVEYTVHQTYYDASGDQIGNLNDSSSLTFKICGANDAPDAVDDDYCDDSILESASLSANVLENDTDVDRTDGDPTVFAIKDADGNWVELGDDGTATVELASGAQVTINSDGSFTYDTNGAWDALNDGEHEDDTFEYQVTDMNGALDSATATVCVDGVGVEEPDPGSGPEHFPSQAISHITLYFRASDLTTTGVDTKGKQNVSGNNGADGWFTAKFEIINEDGSYDLDDDIDDIMDFLVAQGKIGATDKSDLVGVDIKQSTDTVFYLVQGDTNGDASDPYPAGIPAPPIAASEIDAGNYTWDVLA